MPLIDLQCSNSDCENFRRINEVLIGVNEDRPVCELCNSKQDVIISGAVRLNTAGCSGASNHRIH